MKTIQSLRGFRDLYPEDKAIQNFIFDTVRSVARLYGFAEYDGPIVEPLELYLDKTSEEILTRQTFEVQSKGEEKERWILRPEMTPTLARMVAARAGELTYPLRWFNIGARFRYEAPQKGRMREFWQTDFDILGTNTVLGDAELLAVVVELFKKMNATKDDFVIFINSREEMEAELLDIGYTEEQYQDLLKVIDRQDKMEDTEFKKALLTVDSNESKVAALVNFLSSSESDSAYFKELFAILESMGIREYVQLNAGITRGLDYYTGLVFEVKEKNGALRRSLFGGGRYDNLIEKYNAKATISGVGFAFSDVAMTEFLKEKNLLPQTVSSSTKVLVTVFNEETAAFSISVATRLRTAGIATELYPDTKRKLDKQLKYADKMQIPYVIIAGPDEVEKDIVIVKNLENKTQEEVALDILSAYPAFSAQ